MYGKSLACATDHDLSSATLLIESPEILRLREEIESKETPKIAASQPTTQPTDIKIKFVIIFSPKLLIFLMIQHKSNIH